MEEGSAVEQTDTNLKPQFFLDLSSAFDTSDTRFLPTDWSWLQELEEWDLNG